jgi:hypothetical protein
MFNIPTDMEQDVDSLGGAGRVKESDVYEFTVENAYTGQSDKGSYFVQFDLTSAQGRHSERVYFTNKAGDVFFKDKESGAKKPLPGYILVNGISLLTTSHKIEEVYGKTEKKVIPVYDFDLKRTVDTEVNMITPMVGKTFKGGIIAAIEDKNTLVNGEYVPTGETRETVSLDKVFRSKDNKTPNEILAQEPEAAFMDRWLTKNKGVVLNKAKGAKGAQGTNGLPQVGASAPAATSAPNLFG